MENKIQHSMIKSFGGKGSNGFLKEIYQLFPKEYNSFIEPFCGSAVVALNIQKEKCSVIINDLNKNIYSIFTVLQDKDLFFQLKEKLDIIFYSEDIFKESLELLKTDLSLLDRAYHFFIVNRMSYSGNNKSFGKNMCIRRGVSKSVSDLLSTIDGLTEIHEKIQQFLILNRDGTELIEHYGQNEDYFMFLDPPYTWDTRTSTRYAVDFTPEQQEHLMDVLINSKAKILLCGYNNPLYEERLVQENRWQRYDYQINTVTGTNSKKSKIESLWRNYEI